MNDQPNTQLRLAEALAKFADEARLDQKLEQAIATGKLKQERYEQMSTEEKLIWIGMNV